MGAGKSSQSSIVNAANEIVSKIVVNVALRCNARAISSQVINVECDPGYATATNVRENSDACHTCLDNVVSQRLRDYEVVRKTWETDVRQVKKPIDQDYQEVIQNFNKCQINSCKACVIDDFSQSTFIDLKTDCAAYNDITNSITQQLAQEVNQQLTNNEDALSGIAKLLGARSASEVVSNLSSRISTKLTKEVMDNIKQSINNNQVLNVTLRGSSTVIQAVKQDSAYQSILAYLTKSNIMNNVFTDVEWATLNNLLSDTNTLDTLGNVAVQSVGYVSKMLTSTVGKVMFFVLIMVAVIFAGVIIYIISQLIRRAVQKNKSEEEVFNAQISQVEALQTF